MRNSGLILSLLLLYSGLSMAQSLDQRVDLSYRNEKLEVILADISRSYDIRFVYSRDMVPVQQRVSVNVADQPLGQALDVLFLETQVVYTPVAGNIVLKSDPAKKTERLGMELPGPRPVPLIDTREMEARLTFEPVQPLGRKEVYQLPGGDFLMEVDIDKFRLPTDAEMAAGRSLETYRRLAQVSILPYLGTNLDRSDEMTNNISLNLLWGTNGGVDGVEVGGFVNTIRNDVQGVQVAGIGNTVGGNITGTQVSGFFNTGGEEVNGVQVAGLFNVSGETKAVQVGGLFNIAKSFSGVQVSTVFNKVDGYADGLQVAGLFNANGGDAKMQVSTIFNRAETVRTGQISGLLNVAKEVNGYQVGLINVADTISGAPFGLLNIIRRGYNRLEISSGEALFGNLGLKLGARSFYNIFHFGVRWEGKNNQGESPAQQNASMSWALGYGLGTTVGLSHRSLLNIELVSLHVNEREGWTDELNLLNQLRLTFDWQAGRNTSFFAGPTGNLLVSRRRDTGGNHIGSGIAPYTLFDQTKGTTTTQMWIGANAGIRF